MVITPEERTAIIEWLSDMDIYALTGKTHHELFDTSYPTWSRNYRAWTRQAGFLGGTYVLRAIMWYQHVYKPGSTDSRPGIIMPAILDSFDESEQRAEDGDIEPIPELDEKPDLPF